MEKGLIDEYMYTWNRDNTLIRDVTNRRWGLRAGGFGAGMEGVRRGNGGGEEGAWREYGGGM